MFMTQLSGVTNMRCRRLKVERDSNNVVTKRHIVWFGSYGKNVDGTAKFFNQSNKHDNYGDTQVGLADSLTQRLNVLQNELWYAVNEGFPLWGNHKTAVVFDTYITSVVLSHPDVKSVVEFSSELRKIDAQQATLYVASITILSKYGELTLSTSQQV